MWVIELEYIVGAEVGTGVFAGDIVVVEVGVK